MKNFILCMVLVVGLAFAKAQNITAAEYFIDTDPGVGQGTALTINNVGADITDSFTVNIGAQPIGFHRMYVRVQDANNVWSLYHNFLFYVADPTPLTNPALPNIMTMEYFIDTDPGVGMGTQVAVNNLGTDIVESFTTNIGALPIGFHRMYTRVQDANGVWSLYDKFLFYVSDPTPINNPPLPDIVAAEYFLGGTDPGFGNATAVTLAATGNQDQFMFDIDFSGLPGCSTTPFHLRVQDANGTWSLYDFDPALEIPGRTAPTLDVATLADISGTCEVTSLTAPTATDVCTSASITGTTDAVLPITTDTTIIWTYDDGNGNIATQTQNVMVVDNTAPVPDINTLMDVTEQCEVITLQQPTATDNCSGAVTVTNNAVFPITTTSVVTWTYDDGNGNTSTQTQNVVIADTVDPVAIGQDITIDLAGNNSITILGSDIDNGSTDNCSAVTVTAMPDTFTAIGIYTVTLTATDATGNTGTTSVQVTVDDTLSIENLEIAKSIKLFPNPTDDVLNIDSKVVLERIELFDLAGKKLLIKEVNLELISLKDFSEGVYIIQLTSTNGEKLTKRVIKK